jgi:hypothetical protein
VNASWLSILSSGAGMPITAHSAESALYGAKLGQNSNNHIDNLVNGYPDPGMDSWVRFAPPTAASYGHMTLTFWYWAKTQSADYTGDLTDYLCVNVNDGAFRPAVWKQPAPDSNGWQMATVELPEGTVWMEWEFKTGATPSGGPYPGVLIDDVTLTGEPLPTSHVGSISQYYGSRDVQVPVSMSNADRVSLYYRAEGGSWTMYKDGDHPDGWFASSPITFRAPGDGRYELYSIAASSTGTERSKSAAEASMVIDTVAPSLTVSSPKQGMIYGGGPLSVNWTSSDQGSGIARTELRVDGGSWSAVTGTSYSVGTLAEGAHTVALKATDRAGTSSETAVTFEVDPTAPAMTVSPIGGGALLNVTVVASFQEAVDHGSVAIAVNGVDGELHWSGDDAVFVLSSPLEPGRNYNATVTGTDSEGKAFSVDWSFTTVDDVGSISGTVLGPDGQAVTGASVTLSNGAATTTDADGHFTLTGIAPGRYTLTVSEEGYDARTVDVIVAAGQALELGTLSITAVSDRGFAVDLPIVLLVLAVVAGLSAMGLMFLRKRK